MRALKSSHEEVLALQSSTRLKEHDKVVSGLREESNSTIEVLTKELESLNKSLGEAEGTRSADLEVSLCSSVVEICADEGG